ncbi:exodeoxyribonuclease VII small subunit [Sporolactobacillus sp. Y61]|jgi:exodeoxyribonuclease VII small subunit|uniref:Exodeoxyribonuclease 7 small subunit n=1 Tax=Sporolactobacillus sp. Y61 TaxID=3160863 RepID=A0AAU8IDD9_9BACL|nr:exodeoxyribonuclease VII small subunit [Sporolactobacillus sp. THM19-2]RYL87851.1 exodeoxyribonuclease VII small subunit [Sporolactobacillus sp. THM19-2]
MSEEEHKEHAPTFEEAMEHLEQIVTKLEENDVPLEKAIDLFQEGMALSKICHDKLESVSKKMDQMISSDGESKPFTLREDDQQ